MANIDNILDFMISGKQQVSQAKATYNDLKDPRQNMGIRGRAKGLILQYPVLMSDAITLESASAVCRTLEHEYANLLTLLINDRSVTTDINDTATSGFLRGFHNNILESKDIGKWAFKEANQELLNETYDNMIDERSLNDYTVDIEILKSFNEANSDAIKERREAEKHGIAKGKYKMDKEKHEMSKEKAKADNFANMLDWESKQGANIVANDAKKLNDAVPTIIKGVIQYVSNGVSVPKQINFGIKCVCHPVKSTEMKFNLATKVNNPSLLMKFIDWTTGEKRLLTDIIMEKRTMKDLAKSKAKSNFWFRKLEQLSNTADNVSYFRKFLKYLPFGNKIGALLNLDREMPIPCVSLVVSKSAVDQLAAETGIDLLSNKQFANEVMKKFYLLSLVVVDDVSSTAYFYNDVSKRFIQYSMKQLKGFAKDDMLTPEEALKKSLMR